MLCTNQPLKNRNFYLNQLSAFQDTERVKVSLIDFLLADY